jgi:sensor histidine kinase YesM
VIKIENITNLLIKHRWLWHTGYWAFYAMTRAVSYYATIAYYDRIFLKFMIYTEGAFVALTYATLWLYKRFMGQKKYGLYGGLGLLLWLVYVGLVVLFQKTYLQNVPEIANLKWWNIVLDSITPYLISFVLLSMAKYFKDNYIAQYYENERKQLQIQSELQNLKAQISPHFLFNTMNNFYGLAVEKSHKLPELMVRLSNLLRYSLYETNHETVPVLNEIDYLKNYMELEKIRLEDTLDFEFNADLQYAQHFEIAPLIFIVFVENAFKHAKNVEDDVVRIKIDLTISAAGIVLFEVKNNCLTNEKTIDYNAQGIGLENARKRLNVLYPNGLHGLNVEKTGNYFAVKLRINLKKSGKGNPSV